MTPTSEEGQRRRRSRYAERMASAGTPMEKVHAEFEFLRSQAKHVPAGAADGVLEALAASIRAARTQIQAMIKTGN